MAQEIKNKLEQAAEKYEVELYDVLLEEPCLERVHFKAGAQTILDNPGEWALITNEFAYAYSRKNEVLKAENERYREALEKIVNQFEDFTPTPYREVVMYKIAKEVLKKEEQ